jgi:hypothetical protein
MVLLALALRTYTILTILADDGDSSELQIHMSRDIIDISDSHSFLKNLIWSL